MRIGSAVTALCIFAAGCSASGPVYTEAPPPQAERARIYIYRMPGLAYGAKQAHFYVDGVKVFDLDRGGYSYFYASPGSHIISQDWEYWPWALEFSPPDGMSAPIEVKAGETRYFRFSTSSQTAMTGYNLFTMTLRWRLQEYPESPAKIEIKKAKFQKQDAGGFDF